MTPRPEQNPGGDANQQQEAQVTVPTETSVPDAMTTAGDKQLTSTAAPPVIPTTHAEENREEPGAGRALPPPPPRAPKPYDRVREITHIYDAFADRGPLEFRVAFKGQGKNKTEYVKSSSPEMKPLWDEYYNGARNILNRFMENHAESKLELRDALRAKAEQQRLDPNHLTRKERQARSRAIEQRADDSRRTNALLQLEVETQELTQRWLEANGLIRDYAGPLGNLGVYRPFPRKG